MDSFGETGERAAVQAVRRVIRNGGGEDDDASLLELPAGTAAVCTDSVSFARHMPDGMSYEQFGWTAAAVNLSDLAAMGARPVGLMAALMLPEDLDMSAVTDIMSGMDQCAEFASAEIIGGDTKPGPGIVTVTALGSMEGRRPMTRRGAGKGDLIAVTGPLGGPAAGFHALKNGLDRHDSVFSLCVPIPRIEEGIALSEGGRVTSCIDLSDGLSTALKTICRINGLGAVIDWNMLPVEDETLSIIEELNLSDEKTVMGWGGEYELLFTFPKDALEDVQSGDVPVHVIGVMTEDADVVLHRDGKYREVEYGEY